MVMRTGMGRTAPTHIRRGTMMAYPWMEIARSKLGIHEIPGPKANAFIVECLESTTIG